MTDQTQTVEQIAGSLTKAQRRAVLAGHVQYRAGYWPLKHALEEKGLLSPVFGADMLSPLGLALRRHLQEQGS